MIHDDIDLTYYWLIYQLLSPLFQTAKIQRAEADRQGIMSKGKGGKVSSKQLNVLLRNYPQPK